MKRPYAKPTIARAMNGFDGASDRTEGAGHVHSGLEANGRGLRLPGDPKLGKEDFDPAVSITADIVSAYISNNPLPAAELPEFISKIYTSIKLISVGSLDVRPDDIKAVARAKKSVTPEFIICLEDGKRFKSLKRHIKAQYGLTPDQYRMKWNLPSNYPMVAPNYSATRSKLAKSMGLGRRIK